MNAEEILSNSENISLERNESLQSGFCNVWPSAKTGLEMLRDLVKNPVAKGAFSVVIAAGDAVASKICGR